MEFRPFKAGHLAYFKPQPHQAQSHAYVVSTGISTVYETGIALSAWDGVKCVGAGGLMPIWPHKAVAWAFLSEGIGSDMLTIVRKVRRTIAMSPYKRVELTVAAGFEEGHRFAKALGAVQETPEPLRCYGAAGEDEVMYAVLKG